MNVKSKNSFQSLDKLNISGKSYHYFSLSKAEQNGLIGIKKLPKSLKVLLENLLRFEDGVTVNKNQINVRPIWQLNHKISIYKKCPKMNLSNAEKLEKRIICLPSSAHLLMK